MIKVSNEEELEKVLNSTMSVMYFTGRDCGACDVIKVKIESILKSYPNIEAVEIDGEKNIALAAKYGVFSLPIFLLYIDNKETLRVGRNVNLIELESSISRYYNMIFY